MIGQLAITVGVRESNGDVASVLSAVATNEKLSAVQRHVQREVVMGIGAGLMRSDRNLSQFATLDSHAGKMIGTLLADTRQVALDDNSDRSRRAQAIELIGYDSFDLARKTLSPLLDPRQPREI